MGGFSQGTSSIKADAKVGVGNGAHDGLVHLAGQAPLTRTLVVNPIERLRRHRASDVTGCGWLRCACPTQQPAGQSFQTLLRLTAFPGALWPGGPGGPGFWFPLWLICSYKLDLSGILYSHSHEMGKTHTCLHASHQSDQL